MKRSFVVASLPILLSFSLSAGSIEAAGKPVEAKPAAAAPLPPEVTKTVNAFSGRWAVQTTMTPPGGKLVKFAETVECRKGAEGRSAICTERYNAPGEGPTEYDYLIGYDVDTKTVHMYAVGSPGEVHDHRCSWRDDKVLACEPLQASLGGKPITETFSFTFDGNHLTLKGTLVNSDGTTGFDSTGTRAVK